MSVKNQKPIAVIILGVCLFAFFAFLFGRKLPKQTQETPSLNQARFTNGNDWLRLNLLSAADTVKNQIKGDLLKITIESCALSGNPLQNPETPINYYVSYLDNFYKIEENKEIPVFFAFRIADMAANGADNNAVSLFRQAVIDRLKSNGLL